MPKRGRPRHPEILTPREQEVRALLRDGLSNEAMAERLGISVAGVKYHVSEIISKLHVRNRHEAAAWNPEEHRPNAAPLFSFVRRSVSATAHLAGAVAILVAIAAAGVLLWGVTRTVGDEGDRLVAPEPWVIRDEGGLSPSVIVFDVEHQVARRVDLGNTTGFLQWVNNDDLLVGHDSVASEYRTVRLDGTVVRSLMPQPVGRLNQWFTPQGDGQHVLFSGMNGELLKVEVFTGESTPIDPVTGVEGSAQYAWDGTRFAFVNMQDSYMDERASIVSGDSYSLILSDGMVFDVAVADEALELPPNAWSPDGTKVLGTRLTLPLSLGSDARRFRVYDFKETGSALWTSENTGEHAVQWAGPNRLFVKRYDTGPGGCLCVVSEYVKPTTGERIRAPRQLDGLDPSFSPDGRYAVAAVGNSSRVTCSDTTCEAPDWDTACALIDSSTGNEIARIAGTQFDVGTAFCGTVSWSQDGAKAIASQGGN